MAAHPPRLHDSDKASVLAIWAFMGLAFTAPKKHYTQDDDRDHKKFGETQSEYRGEWIRCAHAVFGLTFKMRGHEVVERCGLWHTPLDHHYDHEH